MWISVAEVYYLLPFRGLHITVVRGATGAVRTPKLDKTPNTAARCRRRVLFCKIKVRPRSCRSYPVWRPWVCSVQPKPLFWFRFDTDTKTQIGRYFGPIPKPTTSFNFKCQTLPMYHKVWSRLKVSSIQKVPCIFQISKINIPNHYPEL